MEKKSISLSYREGSSDKVYHAAVEMAPGTDTQLDKWVVNFAYGRRGAGMQTGTKTQKPVSFEAASKILDKLIQEKQAKGYKIDAGNVAVQAPVKKTQTGLYPQLLKAIDQDEVDGYLEDDDYIAQEKMDGERKFVWKIKGIAIGSNRKGQEVNIPDTIIKDLTIRTNYDNFILDGEMIGDDYHVFDLVMLKDKLDTHGYLRRYNLLKEVLQDSNFQHIQLVKAYNGFVPKSRLHNTLIREGKEGIVFKKKDAVYIPGRNSNTQFKRKFYETASFIVEEVNDKRSVAICLFKELEDGVKTPISVGNVSIPVNHQVPKLHDVIEVRYLYAYRDGSVYQPVYLGVRNDISPEECLMSQLKYKGEAKDEEGESAS